MQVGVVHRLFELTCYPPTQLLFNSYQVDVIIIIFVSLSLFYLTRFFFFLFVFLFFLSL